ncbi:MAG: ABC transporter permease, partial [Promethearchaeota archaeon]
MKFQNWLKRLSSRINLQFLKLSWIDMKRDKAKAIFGVLGIAISLFLLTAIGIATDSLNYRTVKDLNDITGSADIIIMREFKTDLTFYYAFEETLIKDKLDDIKGVEEFFPRILMPVKFSSDKTEDNGTLELYGIDFAKEHKNGRMGNFFIVDEDGERTENIYNEIPEDGECVILKNAAILLNVSKGDIIHIQYDFYIGDYEVMEICEQEGKFMQFETAAVILNLEQCQDFFGRPGEINHIIGRLEFEEDFYDARNIDRVNMELRRIANSIQDRLDVNEYRVILPKLEVLESAQIGLELYSMLFWITAFFAMLISGILINSVLTTSVEERVREFGILRVVGGKKSFLIKIVVFEGFLFGLLGTLLGISLAMFVGLPLVLGYISMTDSDSPEVIYMIYPETILNTVLVGSIVPLLIALIPALKAIKKDLVKSINPLLSSEEAWEVKKEESMSWKRTIMGLAVASVGMLLFVLLPQILAVGNFSLIALIFIGLLEAILIGLVLASLGIVPLIQKIYLGIIKPRFKRYADLIGSSLHRYRRRNTSTLIMFAVSFSFIFFLTGINEMESENARYIVNYLYGSDIVMVNQGYNGDQDAITLEIYEDLKEMNAISDISYSLHNTFDIQAPLAIFMESQEEEPRFIEDMTQNQLLEMYNFYMHMISTKYQVRAADISNFESTSTSFISVNEAFLDMVDREQIIWNSAKSGFDYSFNEIFKHNDSCIIATSIANYFGIE